MSNFEQLFMKAKKELMETKEEFDEFKETSKLIEGELESEIDGLTKKCNILEKENLKLKDEFIELKKKTEKEIKNLEQRTQNERKEKENFFNLKQLAEKKKIELENETEKLNSEIRESQMIITDLENKINETLEQLALVQTQLELNQNQSEIHLERLKQQLRETEDELRVYQSSPTRLPDKSNSVVNSPLKFQSPQSKFHSNSIANNKESSPFFAVPMGKPSTFMNFENAMKKMNHTDLKERYKLLKKNPEFRLTIDEIGIKKDIGKLAETTNKQEKMKSKHHLEEKLKTFSANLSHLKSNNDGFHKSLDLVNGLIKGLDLKIQKIRELKEVSPKMLSSLAALEKSPINEKEEEIIFESY